MQISQSINKVMFKGRFKEIITNVRDIAKWEVISAIGEIEERSSGASSRGGVYEDPEFPESKPRLRRSDESSILSSVGLDRLIKTRSGGLISHSKRFRCHSKIIRDH